MEIQIDTFILVNILWIEKQWKIYNPQLVHILEQILFKGKTHSKRGSGLTIIPQKVLKLDICKDTNIKKDIKDIFIETFSSDNMEDNNLL